MMNLTKWNFYIACGYLDLRLGIDGLAWIVKQQYGDHFDEESLFILRQTNRIRSGSVLVERWIYPALQTVIQREISMAQVRSRTARLLDPQSFRWLMEGLRIKQKTAIRKGKPRDLF